MRISAPLMDSTTRTSGAADTVVAVDGGPGRWRRLAAVSTPSVDDLYLWTLAQDGASADDVRAADLADWMSYFDIEPNSLLGIVNVAADHEPVALRLIGKRQLASRPVPTVVRARRRSVAGGQV